MSRTYRQRHVSQDAYLDQGGFPSWLKTRDHSCHTCQAWSHKNVYRSSGDRRKRYRFSEQRRLQ